MKKVKILIISVLFISAALSISIGITNNNNLLCNEKGGGSGSTISEG